MANSDTVFVYTNDDGILCICTPADNCDLTLDQIKAKDCPSDRTVYTVPRTEIPTDKSFRDAWTFTP